MTVLKRSPHRPHSDDVISDRSHRMITAPQTQHYTNATLVPQIIVYTMEYTTS